MDFLIAAALGNDPVLSEPDSTPSSPKSEVLSPGSAQERIKTLQLLMALALPRPHSFDDDDETHADDVAWDFKATPSLPLRSASASASNGSGAPIQTSSVFKCEAGTCSTTCPTSELLADHLNKRHRDATVLFMNAAEEKVVPRDANGLLTCFCGHRPFTYLNGLLKHAKTCSGAKPPPPAIDPAATAAKTFKCAFEGCGKSYNSKTGLTLHVKTKHAIASPAAADSPAASGEIKTEAGSDEKPIVETQGNQDVGSSLSVSTAARTAATTSTPSPITSIPPPNLSFKCDAEKCIQAFATKKGLALHKSKSHGDATVLFLGSTVPISESWDLFLFLANNNLTNDLVHSFSNPA
ncbi:hypothetical protein BC830DRAFT_1080170 [Chytriomyces sp. MP71]|nr:hypothetical protein BC830DRAFT_1080170 [Chytriomyces sp. MP71]